MSLATRVPGHPREQALVAEAQAEEKLKAQRRMFSLIQANPAPAFVVDEELNVAVWCVPRFKPASLSVLLIRILPYYSRSLARTLRITLTRPPSHFCCLPQSQPVLFFPLPKPRPPRPAGPWACGKQRCSGPRSAPPCPPSLTPAPNEVHKCPRYSPACSALIPRRGEEEEGGEGAVRSQTAPPSHST